MIWNGFSSYIFVRRTTVCYPSNKWYKYYNYTVTYHKYFEENQEVCFHHHWLIHYFGQDQIPLAMHMIHYRIQVRPKYFINQVRHAWPRQSVTWMIGWPELFQLGKGMPSLILYIINLPWAKLKIQWLDFRRRRHRDVNESAMISFCSNCHPTTISWTATDSHTFKEMPSIPPILYL